MNRVKLKCFYMTQQFIILALLLQICAAAQDKLLRINTDLLVPQVAAVESGVNGAAYAPTQYDLLVANNNNAQPLLTRNAAAAVVGDKNNNFQQNSVSPTPSADSHICMREETYVEQLKVPTMQPVRIRSSQWCLEFPPRCSNYKTEMREVMQIQNITKTRTIRFCCVGYEGNISINDTVCKPVCRGGCGRGFCQTPDVCSCEAGYTGTHCTQRCDHDHFGAECKQQCRCQNGAVCDNKTGLCHCTIGWTGELCELPCPTGTYGVMCHKQCDCINKRCHSQTGICLETPMETTPAPNATHVIIQTLNSTIANITHNLDRIAKNIVNIAATTTTPVPTELLALTTLKPLPEVIVIKQEDQHGPKIIVHQPAGAAEILGELHTPGSKSPEVIHVITTAAAGWPTQHNATLTGVEHEPNLGLAAFGGVGGSSAVGGVLLSTEAQPQPTSSLMPSAAEHDANLLSTLLIILLIVIIAIGMSWLYIYRRYHWQKQRVEAALAARHSTAELGCTGAGGDAMTMTGGTGGLKSYLKPLPDLPAFTQIVHNKIEGPEFYDAPSNNSSVHTASYDYARKLSLYSVVAPKSRKGSPDSHLYDEIHYPSAFQQHPSHPYRQHIHQQPSDHHATREHHQPSHQHPHQHQHHQQHEHHPQHTHQHSLQQHHSTHNMPHTPHHQYHHSSQSLQHSQLSAYIGPQPLATSTPQHHVSHLIIPPQNAKFLQVPSMGAGSIKNSDCNATATTTAPLSLNVNATTTATRKIALL